MSIQDKLVYTWQLVSFEIRRDNGETMYPFGKDATGMLLCTASGYFSAQLMQNNSPIIISGDPMKDSREEVEANFKGVISYFGLYTIDEKESVVLHLVEESLFPNWKGLPMKRFARFVDDLLELSTEPTLRGSGNTIAILVWKQR